MHRGRLAVRKPPAVHRSGRARVVLLSVSSLVAWAAVSPTVDAQIPRRRPPAATTQSTTAADAGPAPASRPVEPYSPFAEPPARQPSGYVGSSPLRRGNPTSDFLPIPDRWRVGVPADTRFSSEPGAYGGARTGPLDPYKQNVLKGDYPIIGQHTFLKVTGQLTTLTYAADYDWERSGRDPKTWRLFR